MDPIDPVIIAVSASVAGVLLIGLLVWHLRGRRKRNELHDLLLEALPEDCVMKSAPVSRQGSLHGWRGRSKSVTLDLFPTPELSLVTISAQQAFFDEKDPRDQASDDDDVFRPPRHDSKEDKSQGCVWVTASHDPVAEELRITLVKSHIFSQKEVEESSNVVAKVFLLPEEKANQASAIPRSNGLVEFNQTFTFMVKSHELSGKSLRISLYGETKKRIRRSIGHRVVALSEFDLENEYQGCLELEESATSDGGRGQLLISSVLSPNKLKAKITVIRAKELKLNDSDPNLRIHCQVKYNVGHKFIKQKESPPVEASRDPKFHESFVFSVHGRQLDLINFHISIVGAVKSRAIAEGYEYGKVVIGSYLFAHGKGLRQWQSMVREPLVPISEWHPLQE